MATIVDAVSKELEKKAEQNRTERTISIHNIAFLVDFAINDCISLHCIRIKFNVICDARTHTNVKRVQEHRQ